MNDIIVDDIILGPPVNVPSAQNVTRTDLNLRYTDLSVTYSLTCMFMFHPSLCLASDVCWCTCTRLLIMIALNSITSILLHASLWALI